MRNVLFITDFLIPGGVERQTTELVLRLDRARYRPHVVCLYGARAGMSVHFLAHLEGAGVPVTVLDIDWSARAKLKAWREIIRQVRQIAPQIVHAFNYHSNLLTRMARPVFPRQTRLVGSVRTTYTPRQLVYERLSWWLCAAVVCNSPHLVDQLVDDAGVPAKRVYLIANGVDTERFAEPLPAADRDRLRGQVAHALLMVGRVTKQKSPHLFAQALGMLNRAGRLPSSLRAWILGMSEDPDMQAALDQAVEAGGLHDVVEQVAPTDTPERYYQAADVVVLATLWEGLPNVAIEALAAGKPVIISEAANRAGVVVDGVTGWVVRTADVEHLAAALERSLSADTVAMRAACMERAQDYTMHTMVRRYDALYTALTANPSPKTRPSA